MHPRYVRYALRESGADRLLNPAKEGSELWNAATEGNEISQYVALRKIKRSDAKGRMYI
jgi:hypothetical protein